MAVTNNKISTSGLSLLFDINNKKSYAGEPTTNLAPSYDVNGMNAIAVTYIGLDNGWKKYSLSGTWASGTYPYCMALNAYTFTGGVTYSTSMLIKTNVPSKFEYLFTGMNYVNEPMNNSGTSFSLTQSDGSIFVGRYNFQYVSTTGQSGYLVSKPLANGTTFSSSTDFLWIKNVQIEAKTHVTQYTSGSRTDQVSLLDISPNKKIYPLLHHHLIQTHYCILMV